MGKVPDPDLDLADLKSRILTKIVHNTGSQAMRDVKIRVFVFVFSRQIFFPLLAKNLRKVEKISKIFATIDAKAFGKTKIDAKTFAKTKVFAKTFAKMIIFGTKNNFDQASSQFVGKTF
jgi:hypothetical protein